MHAANNTKAALVIDDDEIHHEIIAAALERYNFSEILRAMDGEAARSIVEDQRDRIGLILCDLYMPNFDGIEFLLSLKECDYKPPLLLVSGAKEQFLRSAEELAKVNGLDLIGGLPKPVDFHRFHETLKQRFG
ncbi:MAG: response regulator [Hyphomicrobiaceae bacterium]